MLADPDPNSPGDAYRLRMDIALARRSVVERWNVKRKRQVADRMTEIAETNPDDEIAAAAARVLVTMDAVDIQAFGVLDKVERLDTGKATENVAAVQYIKGIDEDDV